MSLRVQVKRESRVLHSMHERCCTVVIVYRACSQIDWVVLAGSLDEARRVFLSSSVRHEVRFCSSRWCRGFEDLLEAVAVECRGFESLASTLCNEARRLGLLRGCGEQESAGARV